MILSTLQRAREACEALGARKTVAAAAALSLIGAAPALAALGGLEIRGASMPTRSLTALVDSLHAATPASGPRIVGWEGRDIDGDGAPDIVNPTGGPPRVADAFGFGRFGASRDGGSRQHLGVDYVAKAGQAVLAPISGFVTKIGYPYADDQALRYVEITNPALKISARAFYVQASVAIGQAVRLGTPIGVSQTLQARYPGITDHVHLELADGGGRKLDAGTLILARYARS